MAEWRVVPSGGRLSIDGATAWHFYDADMKAVAHGSESPATIEDATAGSLLLLHAPAGSTSTVLLQPADG